jgi:uncharacterized Zn-binding protein involved in type VI secretion
MPKTKVLAPAPVDVSGVSGGVAAISAGGEHTCALMSTGGARCWGENEFGQLGDGTHSGPELCESVNCSNWPVAVRGLDTVVCAASGGSITLSPGVTNTAAIQTVRIKGVMTACSGDPFTTVKYTAKLTTAAPLSCSALNGVGEAATGAVTFKWTPKTRYASTGTLSLFLSETPGVAFGGEVARGSFSALALLGTATERYTGTCGGKAVKKGTFTGSAVSFE